MKPPSSPSSPSHVFPPLLPVRVPLCCLCLCRASRWRLRKALPCCSTTCWRTATATTWRCTLRCPCTTGRSGWPTSGSGTRSVRTRRGLLLPLVLLLFWLQVHCERGGRRAVPSSRRNYVHIRQLLTQRYEFTSREN